MDTPPTTVTSEMDMLSENQPVVSIPGLMDTSPTTVTSELDTLSENQPFVPIPGLDITPIPTISEPQKPENSQAQSSLQLASSTSHVIQETNSGEWTNDEIPEFLNIIRKEPDAEKEPADKIGGNKQMETEPKVETEVKVEAEAEPQPPPLDPWAKLQSVKLKNPVSGLTEYARYLHHTCEFLHLNFSGPSHRPRFRVQVKVNGRMFPVAEGSSKKIAKKDAATIALRRIVEEVAKRDGKDPAEFGSDAFQGASNTPEETVKAPAPKKRRLTPNNNNSKVKPRPAPGMGQWRVPPFGFDYPRGNYREPGFGGPSNLPVCDMNQTPFPDDVNYYPGRNGKEGVGPQRARPQAMFSDDFHGSHVENKTGNEPSEGPGLMGVYADCSSLSDLLLTYLDSFQIENENDAQQVLKVTQKLTDMLVEYRLKSTTVGSGQNSSTSYSFQPSRLSSNSDRFSGQSSFSGAPQRYH